MGCQSATIPGKEQLLTRSPSDVWMLEVVEVEVAVAEVGWIVAVIV